MKTYIIICLAILELATLPATEGYEIIYPYGYGDPMMRSDYDSSQVIPASSRLLFAPLTNFFFNGCPSTLNGGHVIGNTCFSVQTTPTAFAAAELACNANGGTLAQPLPLAGASQNFYKALRTKFPLQFAAVEAAAAPATGLFWIGYQRTALSGNLFLAQDLAGNSVEAANAIFVPPVGAAVPLGAAIFNPGTTWQALPIVNLLPFICQYTTVI